MNSLSFQRHGDKQNSEFFEHYLQELLTERDRVGLTDMIGQVEALMITVDPNQSTRYVGELCLMTPYHYLVTLESESHWTHVLRIDMDSPDLLMAIASSISPTLKFPRIKPYLESQLITRIDPGSATRTSSWIACGPLSRA